MYRDFNELVQWIKAQGLEVALITNGTQAKRVDPETWACFTWVRISLNVFDGWEDKIRIPTQHLSPSCVVGCSMVYTPEHRLDTLLKASKVATFNNAHYVRVLPNCLLEQDALIAQHEALDRDFASIGDTRFFQQHKLHGAPGCDTCHQSYFRPYLSEVVCKETGEPGTVFPCDSVVLNGQAMHFPELFAIGPASRILEYMDGTLKHKFDPRKNCTGCVFTKNVDMLDAYKENGCAIWPQEPIAHENFV